MDGAKIQILQKHRSQRVPKSSESFNLEKGMEPSVWIFGNLFNRQPKFLSRHCLAVGLTKRSRIIKGGESRGIYLLFTFFHAFARVNKNSVLTSIEHKTKTMKNRQFLMITKREINKNDKNKWNWRDFTVRFWGGKILDYIDILTTKTLEEK